MNRILHWICNRVAAGCRHSASLSSAASLMAILNFDREKAAEFRRDAEQSAREAARWERLAGRFAP